MQMMEDMMDVVVLQSEAPLASEGYDEEAPAEEYRVEDLRFSVHGNAGALPWRAEDDAVMKADAEDDDDGKVLSKSFFEFAEVKVLTAPWEDPLPFYANRVVEDPLKKRVISSDRDDGGNKVEPHRDTDKKGDTTFYVTSLKFSPPIRKQNHKRDKDLTSTWYLEDQSTVEPTSTLREPPTTLREGEGAAITEAVNPSAEGPEREGLTATDLENLPDSLPVPKQDEAGRRGAARHTTAMSTASLAEKLDRMITKESIATSTHSARTASKLGNRAGRRTGAHLLAMELGRNITESGQLASFENSTLGEEGKAVEQPSDELVKQAVARAMQNPLYQTTVVDRDKAHEHRPSPEAGHQAPRAGSMQDIFTRERPGMDLGGSIWACATDRALCNVTSRSSPGPCGV